jgi:hypothetical protein
MDRVKCLVGVLAFAGCAVAAGTATAPASAQAPPAGHTVFVHSALSGTLGGGRLTLRGVSRRVTWAHDSGRSGVISIKRLHRRLFPLRISAATGTLHVAGNRGGDELTFKLTRPRRNLARHTVSYKVTRLGGGRLPSRAAQAAGGARQFGPLSLSIVGAPALLQAANTYYECAPPGTTVLRGCWGTVTGSGLKPNQTLNVTFNMSNGSTLSGAQVGINPTTDANGNLGTTQAPVQLDALCFPTGTVSVDVSGVAADGTTTVTAHADAPYYYKDGQFYCTNVPP